MATTETPYTLDNTWEKAHRRLTLLEAVYDPGTITRLEALGVAPGWRCMEVGAGAGSITRWLCDRVGDTGRVTAVDLEPIFLEREPRPNLDIHRRDILAEGAVGEGYDLIHARALFMHLPRREELITDLIGRLRPGGVILLEEGDFGWFALSSTPIYLELWEAANRVAVATGGDWRWARRLPSVLSNAGLVDVQPGVDVDLAPGGSAWAELCVLSFEQLTPLLLADGVSSELIAKAIDELSDASLWFATCALITASGRRPG